MSEPRNVSTSTWVGRRVLLSGAFAAALLTGAQPSHAQAKARTYPVRLVRIVVPYSPGGPIDTMARPLADKLSQLWGQPVLVDNRPGASATIGANLVAKSAPDGYTLLLCNVGELSILPSTFANLPYNPLKDFTPITQLVSGPMVLVVNQTTPYHTLGEMVDFAKAHPDTLTYGSVGPGSISHLAGEMLDLLAKIKLVHVPYKGAGPVITDLLGGSINMAFIGISVAAPLISAGKLRAIGVSTTKRSSLLPEVLAIGEVYPGFEVNSWYGMVGPAGMPKEIVTQLYQDVAAVMKGPDLAKAMQARGSDILLTAPDQFAAKIKEDTARFAEIAKSANIEPK